MRTRFIHRDPITGAGRGTKAGRRVQCGAYGAAVRDANLQVALAGEADANRRYLAYGIQALAESRPDIAQLFFEAAGAETIHALKHLRTMGAIASTRENLETAATGEVLEIDVACRG